MTCKGKVTGGVVVLENPDVLPEGAAVKVELAGTVKGVGKRAHKARPDVWTRLLRLAGTARGLPPDMARNHDHYIHGAPRR